MYRVRTLTPLGREIGTSAAATRQLKLALPVNGV
jgi:hypothetical protein